MRAGLLLLLMLAACSAGEDEGEPHVPGASGLPLAQCAVGGADELQPVCEMEFAQQGENRVLVVWHPDGSFRRFLILPDGAGVEVADGADLALVTLAGDALNVSVGTDRYLLPVNIRGDGGE